MSTLEPVIDSIETKAQPITQEYLDAEYTKYCTHLGDETTKLRQIQAKIEFFNAKIGELLNQGIQLKQAEAAKEVPSEDSVN